MSSGLTLLPALAGLSPKATRSAKLTRLLATLVAGFIFVLDRNNRGAIMPK